MQITCNTSGAYQVQHAVCLLVRGESSAITFDRDEIAFILTLFHWLKPLTDEGGEETGVPGELQKMRKIKPENSRPRLLVYMNDITTTVPRHVSNTLHADDFAVWCAEEQTTASRTPSTRCAAGLRAGLYSSTQPKRSALSSHCPPQRRRSH